MRSIETRRDYFATPAPPARPHASVSFLIQQHTSLTGSRALPARLSPAALYARQRSDLIWNARAKQLQQERQQKLKQEQEQQRRQVQPRLLLNTRRFGAGLGHFQVLRRGVRFANDPPPNTPTTNPLAFLAHESHGIPALSHKAKLEVRRQAWLSSPRGKLLSSIVSPADSKQRYLITGDREQFEKETETRNQILKQLGLPAQPAAKELPPPTRSRFGTLANHLATHHLATDQRSGQATGTHNQQQPDQAAVTATTRHQQARKGTKNRVSGLLGPIVRKRTAEEPAKKPAPAPAEEHPSRLSTSNHPQHVAKHQKRHHTTEEPAKKPAPALAEEHPSRISPSNHLQHVAKHQERHHTAEEPAKKPAPAPAEEHPSRLSTSTHPQHVATHQKRHHYQTPIRVSGVLGPIVRKRPSADDPTKPTRAILVIPGAYPGAPSISPRRSGAAGAAHRRARARGRIIQEHKPDQPAQRPMIFSTVSSLAERVADIFTNAVRKMPAWKDYVSNFVPQPDFAHLAQLTQPLRFPILSRHASASSGLATTTAPNKRQKLSPEPESYWIDDAQLVRDERVALAHGLRRAIRGIDGSKTPPVTLCTRVAREWRDIGGDEPVPVDPAAHPAMIVKGMQKAMYLIERLYSDAFLDSLKKQFQPPPARLAYASTAYEIQDFRSVSALLQTMTLASICELYSQGIKNPVLTAAKATVQDMQAVLANRPIPSFITAQDPAAAPGNDTKLASLQQRLAPIQKVLQSGLWTTPQKSAPTTAPELLHEAENSGPDAAKARVGVRQTPTQTPSPQPRPTTTTTTATTPTPTRQAPNTAASNSHKKRTDANLDSPTAVLVGQFFSGSLQDRHLAASWNGNNPRASPQRLADSRSLKMVNPDLARQWEGRVSLPKSTTSSPGVARKDFMRELIRNIKPTLSRSLTEYRDDAHAHAHNHGDDDHHDHDHHDRHDHGSSDDADADAADHDAAGDAEPDPRQGATDRRAGRKRHSGLECHGVKSAEDSADMEDLAVLEISDRLGIMLQLEQDQLDALRRAEEEMRRREEEKKRKEEEERRRREEEEKRKEEEEKRKLAQEKARKEEEHRAWMRGELRPPHQRLATDLDPDWVARVQDTIEPHNAENVLATAPGNIRVKGRDFKTLVPLTRWLNDEIVNGALSQIDDTLATAAGITDIKTQTRKFVALNSFFFPTMVKSPAGTMRILARSGVTKENFLHIDTILIPICEGNHWTLLIVMPTRRIIAHMDSLRPKTSDRAFTGKARTWIKAVLREDFADNEWRTTGFESPRQHNGYDCGVHAIINGLCLALGVDPRATYRDADMPAQRLRIAAMLLHGGCSGHFDVAGL